MSTLPPYETPTTFHGGYSGMEPRPMQPRAKPAPGEEYVDEAFGTRITRITHARESQGDGAIISTLYSTVPAWSYDERYLLLWSRTHGHLVYQGDRPYRLLGYLAPYYPSDIEVVMWSPRRGHPFPYELVYPTNRSNEPVLYRQFLFAQVREPIKDFRERPLFLGSDAELNLGGDPQWMSRDNRTVGLKQGTLTFSYSIDDDEVVGQMGLDPVYQNALVPSPSGRWAQYGRAVCYPSMYLRRLLNMADAYEHACPGLLEKRVDTWNMVDFDSSEEMNGSLVSHRLDTGEARVIIGPAAGWPYPPGGTHISALGPPELVAVSIVGTGQGQTPLDNEIILANTRTGDVLRVAHCRSMADEGPWGYWSECKAVISPSGTRIAFTSDWGGSPTVDTYVVDLRTERPDELAEETVDGLYQELPADYPDPRQLKSCRRAAWPPSS